MLTLKFCFAYECPRYMPMFEYSQRLYVKLSGRSLTLGKYIRNLVQNSKAVHVFRNTRSAQEVAKVMKLGQIADKIIPSSFKNVSEGVAKLSKGVLIKCCYCR